MKNFLILSFILFPFLSRSQNTPVNALALKSGCRILTAPPSFYTSNEYTSKVDPWTKQALLDETTNLGWCSAAGSRAPLRFSFEFSEEFVLDKLVFDTQGQSEKKGVSAREVQVEISVQGPDKGFLNLGFFTLKENALTEFKLASVNARWIRLSILSNYGNPQYTQMQEFKALGDFADKTYNAANIVGLWDTNFEWVSINSNQNGYIYGCYKWEEGELYSGTITRRSFFFKWSQQGDGLKGWAILTINKEGTKLNGVWGFNENYNQFGFWEFSKNSDKPNVCSIDSKVKDILSKYPLSSEATASRPEIQPELKIETVDAETGAALNADIVLMQGETKLASGTASSGIYQTKVPANIAITIEAKMKGYLSAADNISTGTSGAQPVVKVLKLSKLVIGKAMVLQNIIFQQSKFELLKESYPELDRIVKMMSDHPKMEIEIGGHTDNQGDPQKNLKLSEERVGEVKKYLVSKGIAAARIKGIGFGGTHPIASNAQEETRKMNRRVEIRIVKM